MSTQTVRLFEVGPRDGLQDIPLAVSTEDKIELINRLSETGLTHIEATAFVSPKWIPQMADAAKVLNGIERKPGVRYTALVPNMDGYLRARNAGVDEVAVFTAASETFCQKNINCTLADSLKRFQPIIKAANQDDIPVRGYLSCVIACPFEGNIPPHVVAETANALRNLGCYEISLGDTIGAGTPESIAAMLDAVVKSVPADDLAGHYHDAGNRALSNIEKSLSYGIRIFDCAVGGLGGCPNAPGAKGNVDTFVLVERLRTLGFETGVSLTKLSSAQDLALSIKREGQAA
ncbi:MAG: hydroxymethylglutaryl-CoA lyase [Magnetovibrio sp.]|nr:hydroxymethylglutaryl-CoA lyase [Magnetovibrio sp.]